MNNDDEYSDPIDNFKKPLNSQFSQMHPQQAMQQQTMPQQVIQKPNMNPQQQQAMQQQAMQQQAMQQQAMQQQAMQQQAMQQQQAMHFMKQQQEMQQKNSKSFLEKFGNIKENFNSSNFSLYLQEILILSVLFIFYNTEFSKNLVDKIPINILDSNNKYTTLGALISALIFSLAFIIIKMLI
jgi:flagellar biosynthesis GTPase FlhF